MDRAASPKAYESLVNLSDQFIRLVVTYNVHQAPPHFWGEGQLAVTKSTGSAPTGQEATWLAMSATPTRLAGWATAFINVGTFVQNGYPKPTFFAQFQSSENASRPSSDNDDIIATL
jgi:hypothetical protein